MRLLALLTAALFVVGLLSGCGQPPASARADADAIVGEWKVEKFDAGTDAPPVPAGQFEKFRLVFKKDGKMSMTDPNGKVSDGEYKLDPAATMKALDMTLEGKTIPGLYQLEGTTLTLCALPSGTPEAKLARPTEFKANGDGVFVLTLKRVKDK